MKCPKYSYEITDSLKQSYCRNCEGCEFVIKPHQGFGKVDAWELARLLKERGENR